MKEIHFQRAAITPLPFPLQLSSDATLAVVTKSSHDFHLLDLMTGTTLNISTQLTNELGNILLYNEEISTSTNIPEIEIKQLRWLGRDLCALTNNLNLIIMKRNSIHKSDYTTRFNVNKVLIEHRNLNIANVIKFKDYEKLRLHAFAVPGVDIYNETVDPNYVAVGLENGSITILQIKEETAQVVLDDIQIGSKGVIALEWSTFKDGISYLSITLTDNLVYIQKLQINGGNLKPVELNQIRAPSKVKVTATKWDGHLLSVVSTNFLQCHQAGTGDTSVEIEIGTLYAITNICYLPGDDTKILLANTHNYIAVFSYSNLQLEKLFSIDYNSAKSIETMNDIRLLPLKKKLLSLNNKYSNISIRGVVLDPLGKSLFLGFANNNPPIDHKRVKQMNFRIQQILFPNTITVQEIEQINFNKLNVKYVIQLLSGFKNDAFEWGLLLKLAQFTPVEIPNGMTFSEVVELNLKANTRSLSILQLANQLRLVLGLKFERDIDLEILKFIAAVVVGYIDANNVELTNKYDLSIYQSYKSILGTMKELVTNSATISLTFQEGKFTEVFNFETCSDLSTIVSVSNEIPFKRCSVTLLPMTHLNNLKCESCEKSVINLEILEKDGQEIGDFTREILQKFSHKCIYSGDHLYKL